MLKLTSNLESYLHNKGFTVAAADDHNFWSKNFGPKTMEVLLVELPGTPQEFGAVVRLLKNGEAMMESLFTLSTPLDVVHFEAFLNMNLPSNVPFVKD